MNTKFKNQYLFEIEIFCKNKKNTYNECSYSPTLADIVLVFFPCFLGPELQAHLSESCSRLLVEERKTDCTYCCDSPCHCTGYHIPCYWCDPNQYSRTQTYSDTTIGFLLVTNTLTYTYRYMQPCPHTSTSHNFRKTHTHTHTHLLFAHLAHIPSYLMVSHHLE